MAALVDFCMGIVQALHRLLPQATLWMMISPEMRQLGSLEVARAYARVALPCCKHCHTSR